MQEILDKFSNSVLVNIDKDNFYKIYVFLLKNHCDFIDDIIEDYLDIFIIEYNEFVNKFYFLNRRICFYFKCKVCSF